jgi:hypothetical protein
VLADGRKKANDLAEQVKDLAAAAVLQSNELGAVLSSLGSEGAERDRLAAVVALLANREGGAVRPVRGAFAGLSPKAVADPAGDTMVTSAFTSALHGCLREQPVNAGSPVTTRSA